MSALLVRVALVVVWFLARLGPGGGVGSFADMCLWQAANTLVAEGYGKTARARLKENIL